METNAKILLCVEDQEERANLYGNLLKAGYRFVDEAYNGEMSVDKMSKNDYDVAIVDLWMSGIDGIGVIRAASKLGIPGSTSFILTSPINRQSILIEATEAGADICMLKPFDIIEIKELLCRKACAHFSECRSGSTGHKGYSPDWRSCTY